jgi:hypothetical protein
MADDFNGSIAQNNVTFSIATSVTSVVGQNYYTPMIFIGSGANATANIVTPASVFPAILPVNAGNFGTLTTGPLKTWLASFYAENTLSAINIVTYDSVIAAYGGLTTAYNAYKNLSYQKFVFETGTAGAAKIALGNLCAADILLSQFWSGTSDAGTLASPQIAGLGFQLAGIDCRMVYSAQSGIDPALSSLGLALGRINGTGTPVGNRLDYNRTTTVYASGTTGGADNSNVSATAMANLKTNNIGFWETVGNGTGAVAVYGDLTTTGKFVGAEWFKSYFQYINQVNCATYLTDGANPKYKNNTTYQGILGMMTAAMQPFVTIGVIGDFVVTAPTFANLPITSGNNITIPNAWSATFNRGVSTVIVQGTLYITA